MTYQTKQTKALAMPPDLLATYRQMAQLPGFALLKSDGQHQAEWDIITGLPDQSHTIRDVRSLASVLPCQSEYNQQSLGDYPFQGGIIGYLSYDYGVLAHGLPLSANNPFQQIPIACINRYRWCIAVNHRRQTATLIYDTEQTTVANLNEIEALWHQSPGTCEELERPMLTSLWQKADYALAFEAIMSALHAGRCYQVNLTQPFRLETSAKSWPLYEQISRHNPEPYGAFLDFGDHQILSFSPECFMTIDGDRVTTCPIKGSIARSIDNPQLDQALAETLATSEKDRAENVMIVDLLRNDLSKIAQKGSVYVNRLCELESYPHIHHLVSEISALKQKNLSAFDVLLSAFPGGSITGAPKIEAMKMISELEVMNRGPYCGSIFYFSLHGRLDCNIAIRTITALENEYLLHAGGGIVIDSKLEQEYEECFIKLSAIINAIDAR